MYLDKKQIQSFKNKLKQLLNVNCLVYPNHVFEIFDLSEKDKKKIFSLLRQCEFVHGVSSFQDSPLPTDTEKTFTVRGLIKDNYEIEESIEVHNTLNPKIGTENEELIPEVREKILDIARTFADQIRSDKVALKVLDVGLLGSNANYNYTDQSDLDVHLIADKSLDCEKEHLQLLYNAYKTLFNNKYDITIKGIDVEVYVENPHEISSATTGVYSLKDGGLKRPTLTEIPQIDELKLAEEVNKGEDRYFTITSILNKEDADKKINSIDSFFDDIYKLRIDSLNTEGEFALGNLAFKEIRNLGYLDDLKDLKAKMTAEKLSLK